MNECIFFYLRINTQHIRLTPYLLHEIVLWQIQKLIMLLYQYCFVLLCISKYKPPRAYIRRGDLKEDFLRYEF